MPKKRPSEYGDPTSDVQLTTPAFTQTTVDGVTLDLNSVFCNSCSLPTSPTNLEYFFDITMVSGGALNSLTFGPGFDTTDLQNFAIVQFDPADPANAGDACVSSGTYICKVPLTLASLDFSTVTSTVTCAANGSCTVDFTNFDFATLGGGHIFLAATTPFGGPPVLADAVTGQPLTPSVTINGKSVSVPEPNSIWFAALVGLICFGAIFRQRGLALNTAR
ncbi:MAG TPA: hypothetical protein VLK33_12860 [Terriglobales bacterium]|nr:hypothetical protein [Terriglobales bacterium]